MLTVVLLTWTLSLVGFTSSDTCKQTDACPISREQWNYRSRKFICLEENTTYTCLHNENGESVETCMYEIKLERGVGCPFIICHQGLFHRGKEIKYRLCPKGISECPRKCHDVHAFHDIYKYPACLFPNNVHVRRLTIAKVPASTISTSKDSGDIIAAVAIVPLITILILTFIIFFGCRGNLRSKTCTRLRRPTYETIKRAIRTVTSSIGIKGFKESKRYKDIDMDEGYVPLITATEDIMFRFKESIYEKNDKLIRSIPLSSLENSNKCPTENLFYSMQVCNIHREGSEKEQNIIHPRDIFHTSSYNTRCILMLGLPARGKTTFCYWLTHMWCKAQSVSKQESHNTLSEWEDELREFDFLFFLKLRDISNPVASFTEMVFRQLYGNYPEFHEVLLKIFTSNEYRCLVILDGLDELNPDFELPSMNILNCTMFITTRPLKQENLPYCFEASERILEMKGLDETGVKSLVENILCNNYGLEEGTLEYQTAHCTITQLSIRYGLDTLMHLPLLAKFFVNTLYEWRNDGLNGGGITAFYLRMLDFLIERNYLGNPMDDEFEKFPEVHFKDEIPRAVRKYIHPTRCSSALFKLAKLSFLSFTNDGMTSSGEIEYLQESLNEDKFVFGLYLDLLRQNDKIAFPDNRTNTKTFSISPFRDFLAALHIAMHEKENFKKYISNVEDVLRLSNVLIFMSGLDPFLGEKIMKECASISDCDAEVTRYRENLSDTSDNSKISSIFKMQISCFREIRYSIKDLKYQKDLGVEDSFSFRKGTYPEEEMTEKSVRIHVTDILLESYTHDLIKDTTDLLSDPFSFIKSIYLHRVQSSGTHGIDNALLTRFLDGTRYLRSLFISGYDTGRTLHHIGVPTLTVLSLAHIKISDINPADESHSLVPLLSNMTSLQILKLNHVTLGNKPLGLSSDMTNLSKITLECVSMCLWGRFVQSLLKIRHQFEVMIINCLDADVSTLENLKSSPHFQIEWYEGKVLTHFRRKRKDRNICNA